MDGGESGEKAERSAKEVDKQREDSRGVGTREGGEAKRGREGDQRVAEHSGREDARAERDRVGEEAKRGGEEASEEDKGERGAEEMDRSEKGEAAAAARFARGVGAAKEGGDRAAEKVGEHEADGQGEERGGDEGEEGAGEAVLFGMVGPQGAREQFEVI